MWPRQDCICNLIQSSISHCLLPCPLLGWFDNRNAGFWFSWVRVSGNSPHTPLHTNCGTSGVQVTSGCPRSVKFKQTCVLFWNRLKVKLRLEPKTFVHFCPFVISTTCTLLSLILPVRYSLCNNDWIFIPAQALLCISYSISHRCSNISIKAIKLNVPTVVVTCMHYWWWKTSQYFTRQLVMSFWMIHLFFCFISAFSRQRLTGWSFSIEMELWMLRNLL